MNWLIWLPPLVVYLVVAGFIFGAMAADDYSDKILAFIVALFWLPLTPFMVGLLIGAKAQ